MSLRSLKIKEKNPRYLLSCSHVGNILLSTLERTISMASKKKENDFSFLKEKKTWQRIGFTFLILAIYRIGSTIPVPGTDTSMMKLLLSQNSVFALMNMFGGGSLERMSIFAMGVGPYITASIVVQLLSMDVIPYLASLRDEGKKGQQKLNEITKYVGLVLTIVQATSLVYGFDKQYHIMTDTTFTSYLFTVIVMTAGSMTLVWFGDQIALKGIGGGLSMIIFAGIVSNMPASFAQAFAVTAASKTAAGVISFIIYCAVFVAIILLVLGMELAVRKIPVHYAGRTVKGGNMTYIPFRINSASVLPVIFASSVISAPQIILSFVNVDIYQKVSSFLSLQKPFGLILYAVLIVVFDFVYTEMQVSPTEIANILKKNNGLIPGIRAGSETINYLTSTLRHLTVFGASGLLVVALIPYLVPMLTQLPSSMGIGGTGIIIVVGVALETIRQLQAENTKVRYKDYVNYKTFERGGIFR